MANQIGILNCYADEPKSAPSAHLFYDVIPDSTIINVSHGEKIKNIKKYNGYIISGSRSKHKDKEVWIGELIKIINRIHHESIPCLAVCFGHQVLTRTFGGTTVRNLAGEDGFQEVPTVAGDIFIRLFADLPNPVMVFQSHKDAVMKPPYGSINTIYNQKCVQYYQFGSFYSIQAHPEVNVATAKNIAKKEHKNPDTLLNGVNEENYLASKILTNFVDIVDNYNKIFKLELEDNSK